MLCDGTLEERLQLCFDMYDSQATGVLSQRDLKVSSPAVCSLVSAVAGNGEYIDTHD